MGFRVGSKLTSWRFFAQWSINRRSNALSQLGSVHTLSRHKYLKLQPINPMTIDKSLKIKAGSAKTRNVLTRAERLTKLMETERWSEGDPVYGMPKVRVQKISLKKKKKVKKADEEK
jgi:small basic protein (TIGR04137 family)